MPLPKVDEWLDWCKKYNLTFDSDAENIYRHWVWLKNYEMIQRHNARTDSTYKMGLNQFSYMEHWEFVEMNLRRRGVIKDYNEPDTPESSVTLPNRAATTAGNCLSNNFDWRDKFPSITARDQVLNTLNRNHRLPFFPCVYLIITVLIVMRFCAIVIANIFNTMI